MIWLQNNSRRTAAPCDYYETQRQNDKCVLFISDTWRGQRSGRRKDGERQTKAAWRYLMRATEDMERWLRSDCYQGRRRRWQVQKWQKCLINCQSVSQRLRRYLLSPHAHSLLTLLILSDLLIVSCTSFIFHSSLSALRLCAFVHSQ